MGEKTVVADITEGVQSVCRDIFRDPALVITRELTAADVHGWDSLSHMRLMLAIEKKFSVKFKASEAMRLKNLGDLLDMISAKMLK